METISIFSLNAEDVQKYQKGLARGQRSHYIACKNLQYLSSRVDETKGKKHQHQGGSLFEPLGEKKSAYKKMFSFLNLQNMNKNNNEV
jgi:hypothetical protein